MSSELNQNPHLTLCQQFPLHMKNLALIILILLGYSSTYAQYNLKNHHVDSTFNSKIQSNIRLTASPFNIKVYNLQQAIRVPALLTAAGLLAKTDNEFWSNEEIKEERDEYIPNYRHRIDDYLQFAPIAAVYGLDALGVKAKTDFANRTAILIKTEIILAAITFPLKKFTAVPRPDTGQPTSFPSGHTAQAFAAATFMAKEYGHQSPWYSIGAYSVATTVGVMRMMNNRHWLSDVFVGAGVGILSTNLAYMTHQYKWGKNRKNVLNSTLVIPSYDGNTGMLSIVHKF